MRLEPGSLHIFKLVWEVRVAIFFAIATSVTAQRRPESNPLSGSGPSIPQRGEYIQTSCKYVRGLVNTFYEGAVRNEDSLVYQFYVERKYFEDAANTNLRFETEVDRRTTLQEPILFSVGQRKHITTFELPHVFLSEVVKATSEDDNRVYFSAGRNLCIQRRNTIVQGQNITVRISTFSTRYERFRLKLHLSSDFQLQVGKPISLTVSPMSPRYLGFQSSRPDFEEAIMKIKAMSDSEDCMTLSVQSPMCPIYDKETNIKYQGLWQTMTTQSAMTLSLTNRFVDGFVVVLVAHSSDVKCSKSEYMNPYAPPPMTPTSNSNLSMFLSDIRNSDVSPRMKTVTLLLTKEDSVSGWIIFAVLAIPVFTTFLILLVVTLLFRNRHEWMRVEAEQVANSVNCGLLSSSRERAQRPQRLIIQPTPSDELVLHELGVLPTPNEEDGGGSANGGNVRRSTSHNTNKLPTLEPVAERFLNRRRDNGKGFKWRADLTIADFQIRDAAAIKKSGKRFYWTIVIVAIFYCIPVYQLILHYLRVLYRTGEYDICYYNYLCAHRLGLFVDFNHWWSNVSYVIFGFAFVFLVGRRANSITSMVSAADRKTIMQEEDDSCQSVWNRWFGYSKIPARSDHGIPQNWGIFYTMGIALAMEGVLSAAYHLCPNQSSFQFDTCFMYVISVLILLKIHQFRHSAHLGATHTFFILASFVLFSVIGLMFEFQGSAAKRAYRWTFIALQFVTMGLLSIYLYSVGYVRCKDQRRVITDIKIFRHIGQLRGHTVAIDRLILPLISLTMGIAVLIYCELGNIDFATYLLYVLVSNVIGSTLYYVGIMKPLHGEFKNRTWVQPSLYFLGAGIIGGFAVRYFVRSPAQWELSAAASRAANEDCMSSWFPFYPYYDSHDVWHFLSAASLFLSFMALLIVDDDLLTTPHREIAVF